jgi:peptidoglycan/LPS O-acetylase OafA/YrhL
MTPASEPLPRPAAPGYALLDAWRGIAALMVVVFHATATLRAQTTFDPRSAAGVCVLVLDQLWLGVQVFFVISGYCIAATADSVRRKPASVKTFAMRRFMRIYPTFIVWAIAMLVVISLMQHLMPDASFWRTKNKFIPLADFRWFDWIGNFTLTNTWLPRIFGSDVVYSLVEVSWTLCYEVQFYFVCGVLLAFFPRRFFAAAGMLTIVLAALFVVDPAHGTRFPPRTTFLDVHWLQFAMGIGVYHVVNYRSWRWQSGFAACLAALGAVCWSVRAGVLDDSFRNEAMIADYYEKYLLGLTCCSWFAALLVPLKAFDGRLAAARWLAPLTYCGVISYSLYLVHWPFCKVISIVCWNLGLRTLPATLAVTTSVCAIVSLIAAIVYFRLVERRFIGTRSPRQMIAVTPLAEPLPT